MPFLKRSESWRANQSHPVAATVKRKTQWAIIIQGVQQFLANFDAFLQRQNLNEIWSVADVQG
jgi:hypothetical protein